MKKILLMAAAFVGSLALKAQEVTPDQVVKVNTEKHDFGKIKQGVPVSTYFQITNISDKPIVIENAYGSCGCTTPEIPKEPIAPNATAKLKVNYNAAAVANFDKEVYVKLAGIQQNKVLKITGEVLDPTAYDAYVKGQGGKKEEAVKEKTEVKENSKKVKVKATTAKAR